MGVWEWDVGKCEIHSDDRMKEIFGFALDGQRASLDRYLQTIHPEDRDRVSAELNAAAAGAAQFDSEFRTRTRTARSDG